VILNQLMLGSKGRLEEQKLQ